MIMGGRIEDYIFEVLGEDSLTTSEINDRLAKRGNERSYSVLNRHLRKMTQVSQLEREKISTGEHTYSVRISGRLA
jgi:hypothetical protein